MKRFASRLMWWRHESKADRLRESLVAQVRRARWDGSTVVIEGFAYIEGEADGNTPVRVRAHRTGRRPIKLTVEMRESAEVDNLSEDRDHSHAGAAFVASIDASRLAGRTDCEWRLEVTVRTSDRVKVSGRFTYFYRWGSAWHLGVRDVGKGAFAGLEWNWDDDVTIKVTQAAALVETFETGASSASIGARLGRGFTPISTMLVGGEGAEIPGALVRLDDQSVRLDWDDVPEGRWSVAIVGEGSNERRPLISPVIEGLSTARLSDVAVLTTRTGDVVVERLTTKLVITDVDIVRIDDRPMLEVHGRQLGLSPDTWVMTGPRVDIPVAKSTVDGEQFTVWFPLWLPGPWATRSSAAYRGGYRLVVPEGVDAQVTSTLAASFYRHVRSPELSVRLECDPQGVFHLHAWNPRADDELGRHPQRELQQWHGTTPHEPEDAVLFEAFSGRSANDNTAAIAAEFVSRRPDLTPYWSVIDMSVVVPEGIEPVVRYSRRWWGLLGSARYVVTNSWLPGVFTRQPHQRVMQAWHGTPYKRMGLDRIGRSREVEELPDIVRQASMWSQLLAQNEFSAITFRDAYAYPGEVLVTGYPRNDILHSSDRDEVAAATRERLGLAPDQRVVLYLPTWREDSKELFAGLDLTALSDGLGPDVTVLLRGHSNTIRRGRRVQHGGVIDVTLYPEVSELYLIADVLITDYSSAMFDFSVTGRPIVFFAPDIEYYTSTLRGAYFDLAETAPGPILETTAEVIDALRDLDTIRTIYADRYRVWQETYNPLDDGLATKRAVDALLRELN